MAENSAIEWTDHTWSPWEGCTKVSPGCDHCYAEGMNRWLRKGTNWGPGAPRRTYSEEHWAKPLRWNAAAAKAGRRVKVFPSVCDPFDNEAPAALLQRFMSLIVRTPHLDWLLLTKRIGNAKRMLSDASMHDGLLLTANDEYRPPANLWLGATVIDQQEADRDVPKLLATPAALRFLSCEPLLGPVCLTELQPPGELRVWLDALRGEAASMGGTGPMHRVPRVDWVIAGGESGRGARPSHPDWFRGLRDQCAAAGVPFMFKQWGEWLGPLQDGAFDHDPMELNASDQPIRVGKKAAGRLLDGRTHDGFPA